MGKFKVGDRVRFLSSKGGGVIRSFAATNVANVEDDSGFEIPTLVSDLILEYCQEAEGTIFASPKPQEEIDKTKSRDNLTDSRNNPTKSKNNLPESRNDFEALEDEDYDTRISPLYLNKLRNKTEEGVYLCFVPQEQKWLVYGDMDIYLVNFSSHRVIYSVLLDQEGEGFVSEDFGTLESEEKVLLSTVSRDKIDNWKKACVQLMFHDDVSSKVFLPVNCEMKIRTNRFFTEGSFIENAFFAEKAVIYPVCTMISVGTFLQSSNTKNEASFDKMDLFDAETVSESLTATFLSRHLIDKNTAEVDLHIEELVEDYASLEKEQMLDIQMRYAVRCLNEAIIENVNTIIFIHGVGQGVLKNELCRELDKYKGLHYFDAPMAKYGVGATQVYIGTNFEKIV